MTPAILPVSAPTGGNTASDGSKPAQTGNDGEFGSILHQEIRQQAQQSQQAQQAQPAQQSPTQPQTQSPSQSAAGESKSTDSNTAPDQTAAASARPTTAVAPSTAATLPAFAVGSEPPAATTAAAQQLPAGTPLTANGLAATRDNTTASPAPSLPATPPSATLTPAIKGTTSTTQADSAGAATKKDSRQTDASASQPQTATAEMLALMGYTPPTQAGERTPATDTAAPPRQDSTAPALRVGQSIASSTIGATSDSSATSGTPAANAQADANFANQLAAQLASQTAPTTGHGAHNATDPAALAITQAGLGQAGNTQAAGAALPSAFSGTLAPRVGTAEWDQSLSQHIVWMAHGAEQTASLTLNPPDLGPLRIVLNVSNNQASATFIAQQPEVRQALENALPRLEAMMNSAGIQLGQTSVRADTSGQQDQSAWQRPGASSASATRGIGGVSRAGGLAPAEKTTGGQGLINTFV